jgi:hypothetical protein
MRTNYESLTNEYEPVIADLTYYSYFDNAGHDDIGTGLTNVEIVSNNSPVTIFTNQPFVNLEVPSIEPFRGTPFTQLDEHMRIHSLFFHIRRSVKNYGDVLAENLITLYNFSKEEDPYDIGISYDSLYNFISFLSWHTDVKKPVVSLTPEKNIYCSWRAGNKRVFSAHFLPNSDVRFVLFNPNDKHPNRISRISGVISVDQLYKVISPYQLKGWVTNEG